MQDSLLDEGKPLRALVYFPLFCAVFLFFFIIYSPVYAAVPTYVNAAIGNVNSSTVAVIFSEAVVAAGDDYSSGVTIKVNNVAATISSGTRQADQAIVYYVLSAPVTYGDAVTVSYSSTAGVITNADEEVLATFSERSVINSISDTALISDTFTDADSTAIAAHTIAPINTPATSWRVEAGTWSIQDGKVQKTATVGTHESISLDVGQADAVIEASIQRGTGSPGVVGRLTDNTHWIGARVTATTFDLYQRNGGFTLLQQTALTISPTYRLRLSFSSTTVTATVNDGNTLTASTAFNQAATRFGLWTDQITPIFDNVRVGGSSLPSSRSPGLLVFDGNSLTSGTGATAGFDYPSQAVTGLKSLWNKYNYGVGGQTTTQMLSDVSTQVDTLYDIGNLENIVIPWEITNELYGGTSETDAYNNYVTYCQARRAAGFKVVAVTVLPRSNVGTPVGFEAARQAANTDIRNNWTTFADALADVAADTSIGDAGDELDTTYYNADKVHMNDAGYGVVAGYVATAINEIMGPSLTALGPTAFVDGSSGNDTTPTLRFVIDDADEDLVSYGLQIDDSADFSSPLEDYSSAFAAAGLITHTSTVSLPDDSYYWRVRATDGTATSSWSQANGVAVAFVVDATPSTVVVTTPSAAAPVNTATTFAFTSSEPGTQECNINGGAWEACASGDAFSTLSGFAGLGEGTFTLNVRDTDAVGNIGSDGESFVKDTVAPSTPVIAPNAGSYDSPKTIFITSAGSNSIKYTTDGTTPTCTVGTTYTAPFALSSSVTVNAVGCDAALNVTSVATNVYSISSGGGSGGGGSSGSLALFNYLSLPSPISTVSILPLTFTANSLVKLANDGDPATQQDSAVYYYGRDGHRHAFPNDKVYFTWYSDFSQVQVISATELARMPLGQNVTYRPGVRMVKFTTFSRVYAVDAGGLLRWVKTEDVARALYGPTWNQQIDDISDAFYGNYQFGNDINSAADFNPSTVTAAASSIQMDMGF